MNGIPNYSLFIIFLTILCLTFSNCILDREGGLTSRPSHPIGEQSSDLSWGADAFPGYACPRDNIVLKWNVGDPQCREGTGPECQTLTVVDTIGLLGTGFTSGDLSGEHSAGSVSEVDGWARTNPIFTFSVTHDDESETFGWDDRSSIVEIILQDSTIENIFSPGSACNTTSCKWKLDDFRLDMKDQSFINDTKGLGECVRIHSICYRPIENRPGSQRPAKISISVVESGETRLLGEIDFRECIEDLNLEPDLEYIVQPVGPTLLAETGECCSAAETVGAELSGQPFIDLLFTLGCDSSSEECIY